MIPTHAIRLLSLPLLIVMTHCNEIKNMFPKVTQEPPINRYTLAVDNAFPEGMALSSDGMAVTGSLTTGAVYTAELPFVITTVSLTD